MHLLNFTAVTGWGAIIRKWGSKYSNQDGSIIVANAKTYVHLRTTREWILVQDQATDEAERARLGVEQLLRDGRSVADLIARTADIHVADPQQRKTIQIQARRCFARRVLIAFRTIAPAAAGFRRGSTSCGASATTRTVLI